MALADARRTKGLSLRELALLSGVGKTHISDLERGKRNPSMATARRLARALRRPVVDLFPNFGARNVGKAPGF